VSLAQRLGRLEARVPPPPCPVCALVPIIERRAGEPLPTAQRGACPACDRVPRIRAVIVEIPAGWEGGDGANHTADQAGASADWPDL
jgi:hypothetical protein